MVPEESLKAREESELPRIPGYRLEKIIGRGATGVVYRAVQLAVDRPVALKILHRELVGTKRAVRRLQREARTAAKLAHPNIISAIDMGEIDGQWWYAMELVEGESLAERLRGKGCLSEREALRLFPPLAEALQHAAEAGVVHRDIKPANILLDGHGRARLVDLGLAFTETDPMLTSTGGTLGTPHYMSPEQARDPAAADSRSDIWSLGATLYHALCGRPPFTGESVAEILSGVLYHPIVDPRQLVPALSKGMALVLRKCLARDPARRYSNPGELLNDLERLRERRAPLVRAGALDPLAPRWPAWVPRVAAVLGLVLLGVVLLWFTRLGVRGPDPGSANPTVPANWPELSNVEQRFEQGEISAADALARIDSMRLPEGLNLQVRRNALRTSIRTELEAELATHRVEVERRMEELLENSDFDGAEEWLARGAEVQLEQRTGFARLQDLPPELSPRRYQDTLDQLRGKLQRQRRAARDGASSKLRRHMTTVVVPEVRQRIESKRWRDALESCGAAVGLWLEEEGTVLAGLNDEERSSVIAAVDNPLNALREEVREDLARVSDELATEIRRWGETARRELQRGEREVASRLSESFRQRLEAESIDLEQVPEGETFPATELLAQETRKLADEEERLVENDARRYFEECEIEVEPLLERRAYREAVSFWRARLDYGWPLTLRTRVHLRVRECEHLNALLDRAAKQLLELDGERVELNWHATILEEGQLIAGADPVGRGFQLQTSGRVLSFALVRPERASKEVTTIFLHDLEFLAGLSSARTRQERLELALLRYHEGDFEGALAAFPGLATSEDDLASDLRDRIDAALAASNEQDERLRNRIDYSWRQVKQLQRTGKTQGALREIREVLDDPILAALLSPAERIEWKHMRDLLSGGPARRSLEEAFAPDQIEQLTGPREFRMSWDFDHPHEVGWKSGKWRPDSQGWIPLKRFPDDKALFEWASSPHLRLDPPIDIESSLRVRLRMELLQPDSPTQTLVITLAGFHFAFLIEGTVGHWRVDTTSAEATLAALRQVGTHAATLRPLPGDEPFEIELHVHPQSPRVESVTFAGERLEAPLLLPPDLRAPTLEIRALEKVRLLSVVLEGKRQL